MSDQGITLELQKREIVRKGLAKLRHDGLVPGVIHDHGKPSIHVQADYQILARVYSQAGKHHMVELKIGPKTDSAIIKDVNFDPVKNRIRHIVFQAVRQNETIETDIPVVLDGEIPAEKAGLMIINGATSIKVESLPKDLPDEIKIDATSLAEIGDKITVADIVAPSGVTILTEPETPIASVEETKEQISEEAKEEVEGEEATSEAGEESEAAEKTEEE